MLVTEIEDFPQLKYMTIKIQEVPEIQRQGRR